MPNGSDALNSTENNLVLSRSRYLRQLDVRRETEKIRQLTNFGLTIGWVFTLLGGFCWFCVISHIDWFWSSMMTAGLVMLCLGTVLPQLLDWPHRLWMGLAQIQGRLVMTLLLTVVYFALVAPLGSWERKRRGGSHPFHSWDNVPPTLTTGWEPLPQSTADSITTDSQPTRSRSLISLFTETLFFFAERGHYLLLPILLVLMLLGLILFFVQTSALAPFIYTIGVTIL